MNELIKKQMDDFALLEGQWIDSIIKQEYPAWLCHLAESAYRAKIKILLILLAKFSGLRVERSQATSVWNKGYTITSVTTKILRKDEIIAQRKFNLNIYIDKN